MKSAKLLSVLGVIAAVGVGTAAFKVNSQHALQSKANITEAEARALALAAVPGGTIVASELEDEDGQLAYEFEIQAGGVTSEVKVDAITGKVGPVTQDNDDEENEDEDDDGEKGEHEDGGK